MSDRTPLDDPVDRFLGELGGRAVPADLASTVMGRARTAGPPPMRRSWLPQALTAAVVIIAVGTVGLIGFQSATLTQPSTSPTTPSLIPSASYAPGDFEFARITAEGVEIRTEPAGGEVITSTSGDLGDLVLVLARQSVEGTEWVRVEHWSPRGYARFGWMPLLADLATPVGVQRLVTLEPATAPCENVLSTDPSSLTIHPPSVRLACAGSREIRLAPVIARNEAAQELASGEPSWLATLSGLKLYGRRGWDSDDVPLDIHVDPSAGISLPTESWLEVTGHFDDPAAATCQRTSAIEAEPAGDPTEQVLWCRQQFVVTGFRRVAAPEPTPSPTPAASIAGRWEAIADAPIQGRGGHSAIWTGTEMIVWGGEAGPAAVDDTRTSDGSEGAAYDPRVDRWRVISTPPIDGRTGHLAAWTGREMLIWGGWSLSGYERLADGAAYDPVTDTWRSLPPAPFAGTGGMAAAWTGRTWMVIDGITDVGGPITVKVAEYDPQANTWQALPDLEAPASVSFLASWTGQDLFVVANPYQGRSAVFALRGDEDWQELREPPFDGLNAANVGIWTGTELIMTLDHGRVTAYDPVLERWRSATPPPAGRVLSYEPVWTGTLGLFFSGSSAADVYDPTRDRWFSLPPSGDRFREFASGIWAGDRFIAWGGVEGESFLRKPDGIAFVPDAYYVDAPVQGSRNAVRVEIVDASGDLVDARAATDAELGRDATGRADSGVLVTRGENERTLLIRWIGGPGDRAARLEIGTDPRQMDLVLVPTYGDAMAVGRGIVLTFRTAIDPVDVSVRAWTGRQ